MLCDAWVCPTRRRESISWSWRFAVSVQGVVSPLIFRMNGCLVLTHSWAHATRIVDFTQCLRSAPGTALVNMRPVRPMAASWSASTLPLMPQWPGTHSRTVPVGQSFWMAWIHGWRDVGEFIVVSTLAESEITQIGFDAGVVVANSIAAASAEKTEHWSGIRKK